MKNLKIKIKNTQLAKIKGLYKDKNTILPSPSASAVDKITEDENKRTIRAKTKSAFETKPLPQGSEEPSDVFISDESIPEPSPLAQPIETPEVIPPVIVPSPHTVITEEKIQEGPVEKELSPTEESASPLTFEAEAKAKGKKVKEFKDLKSTRSSLQKSFTSRDRRGLTSEEEDTWRKHRSGNRKIIQQQELAPIVRPSSITVRLPVTVKDLAAEMKLKAAELIQKLFLNGMIYTLNDYLEDQTVVQYLGLEFHCDIHIDSSEEERIRITSKDSAQEIAETDPKELTLRPPIVTFMGHVDHGKTSLIDAIRKSNIVAEEAGAITQHIGAFCCHTKVGNITILDTPGHEAFSAMRARGVHVTDIVVLVIAGDEGIREQTLEAIQHAKAAGVTIIVAINKSDKPGVNIENIYRQLADVDLLPEAWGGSTITVQTSAVTHAGIPELLEMLALQAEVLELKANPHTRARGVVLESELHKGLGLVATILVQNGTLHKGDALVFDLYYGRVKTMHNEYGQLLVEAPPSYPVEITGITGLPKAGEAFIVVSSEKEAKSIATVRQENQKRMTVLQKRTSLEQLLQHDAGSTKKILKVILRADVQGSLEALQSTLARIHSDKVILDVVFSGVGEISESDVQLAIALHAVIIGFHVQVETHALPLVKEGGVIVRLHDVIYHIVDNVKDLMRGTLDKLSEELHQGSAEVIAIFKSSQFGVIAGCIVQDGSISRSDKARVLRQNKVLWTGSIASIKRLKEDVKEVKKGLECGIVLQGYHDMMVGDRIETFQIQYREQTL